jgi:hypothetical protein
VRQVEPRSEADLQDIAAHFSEHQFAALGHPRVPHDPIAQPGKDGPTVKIHVSIRQGTGRSRTNVIQQPLPGLFDQ